MARLPIEVEFKSHIRAFATDLVALVKRATVAAVEEELARGGPSRPAKAKLARHVLTPVRRPRSAVRRKEPVSLARYERMAIERAIAESGGDIRAAAKLLNLSKSAMYRRVRAVGARRGRQAGGQTKAAIITTGEPVSLELYERLAIQRALDECGGDRVAAAKLLGIGRSTLYRKTKALGIPR